MADRQLKRGIKKVLARHRQLSVGRLAFYLEKYDEIEPCPVCTDNYDRQRIDEHEWWNKIFNACDSLIEDGVLQKLAKDQVCLTVAFGRRNPENEWSGSNKENSDVRQESAK